MNFQKDINKKIYELALDSEKIFATGLKNMYKHDKMAGDKYKTISTNNCHIVAYAVANEIELITGKTLSLTYNSSLKGLIDDFKIDLFNCYLITFYHTETATMITGHSFVTIKYNPDTFETYQSRQTGDSLKEYLDSKETRQFTFKQISELVTTLYNMSQNVTTLQRETFIWKSLDK